MRDAGFATAIILINLTKNVNLFCFYVDLLSAINE